MNIKIRKVRKKDLISCEKLIRLPEFIFADGDYPDYEYLSYFLETELFFVAEEGREVVAFIFGEELVGKSAIIWYISVDKKLRGKGIGEKLMDFFEKECKKRKIEWVVLHSPAKSEGALNFYRKLKYNEGDVFVEFNKKIS